MWDSAVGLFSPLRGRLGAESMQLIVPAIVVGLGAGLAAVVFRWLITGATWLFTGTLDYSATHGNPASPWVPWLGGAFVIFAPAIGGLLYGPLVNRFAPEARGHGVPEVMFAVAKRGGRIRGSVAVVKALASAICIGSGGSVGREGPIVQIGSALGSTLGRILKMPESRLRTLVACGAAGGIAATFNAPIAGVFFALELLLRDFAASSFGAVVLASITASVVGRSLLGNHPFLYLPSFSIVNPWEYALFAVLGLVAGLAGVGFSKVLYLVEDFCDWAWRGPEWLRPVVGGLFLGGLLFVLPQMYGVGYPVLQIGASGGYALGFLLLLLVGKILATSITIGIGGSGGVFAPSLFIGAMLGAGFGEVVGAVDPALAGQTSAFALVGMGAVFAGSARAPITAAIILFELTGDYSIILPLLLSVVVATGVSKVISKDTIYTLKLIRRGVDLEQPTGSSVLSSMTVAGAMIATPTPLLDSVPASDGIETLLSSGRQALPIIQSSGGYAGVLTRRAATAAMNADDDLGSLTVGDIMDVLPNVASTQALEQALDAVLESGDSDGIPVLDSGGLLCGWLPQDAILRALAAGR